MVIIAISMQRLVLYLQEANQTFFRHDMRGAFEGFATSPEMNKKVAPSGEMTPD